MNQARRFDQAHGLITIGHQHRWRIEEVVDGREYSPGACKCGDTREFRNWEKEPLGWVESGKRGIASKRRTRKTE